MRRLYELAATIPYHPVLFGLAPVAAVAAANLEALAPRYWWRPAILTILGSLTLIGLFGWLTRDRHRSAALTSVICISLLYTPIRGLISAPDGALRLAQPGMLLAVIAVTAFLLLFLILWRYPRPMSPYTPWLNAAGIAVLVLPMVQVVAYQSSADRTIPPAMEQSATPSTELVPTVSRPDIYYIILDGYARDDILRSLYGYDNSSFLSFLDRSGFFVASHALSNYAQTSLSLASSLNMTYLDVVAEREGQSSSNQRPLAAMVGSNQVLARLKALGYRTYALASEYQRTEMRAADVLMRLPLRAITPFEALLIDKSAFSILSLAPRLAGHSVFFPGYQSHRELVEYGLQQLTAVRGLPGPKFVFAHLVIPHPPFVYLADGRPVNPAQPYLLRDGNETGLSPEEYVQGYVEQLIYINRQMEAIISLIQDDPASPPVIILQGDHGPGSRLNWDDPTQTDLLERHAILNAYYLAGESDPSLAPSTSPVNSFRIVLNHFFGAGYDLLPDRGFYSSWRSPYRFLPVANPD